MIRAHRRRHLRVFAVLAVALPAILVAALAVRRAPPVVASAPTALTDRALDAWVALDSAQAQVLDVPIRIRLLAPTANGRQTRLGVEIEPSRVIGKPDMLVYWTGALTAPDGTLPQDALLMGSLGAARPRRFELPGPALQASRVGSLILYSAAHREVLGFLPVPPQAPAGAPPSP